MDRLLGTSHPTCQFLASVFPNSGSTSNGKKHGKTIMKSHTAETKQERPKDLSPDLIWTIQILWLSIPEQPPHPSRSTNWPPFFGTFSTMIDRPTWPSWNDWRTQIRIRFRSSRRQTWPTLQATWLRLLTNWRNKRHRWRRFPKSVIRSTNLVLTSDLSDADNSAALFFPVF